MKIVKQILLCSLIYGLFCMINSCNQINHDRTILGIDIAKEELKSALNDSSQHNVINYKDTLIKDKISAIKIAETILFKIYGQDNIEKQRPYEVYNIDNYWILSGTLPKDYLGGTFLIIIDSRDCKIIRITHGK